MVEVVDQMLIKEASTIHRAIATIVYGICWWYFCLKKKIGRCVENKSQVFANIDFRLKKSKFM
jgi:hypothetical protein